MLKGAGTSNGKPTVFLGLSFGNLRKFLAEPLDTFILIDGATMGLPHDILLFSGETEEQMAEAMTSGRLRFSDEQ